MGRTRRRLEGVSGDYNRICDRTGFVFKRSELVREELTNILVHPKYVDPPHPYDYPLPRIKEEGIREDR